MTPDVAEIARFKARLGNRRRWRIFKMRYAARFETPTHEQIARRLGISRQMVSKDLKVIRRLMADQRAERAGNRPGRSRAA